MFRPILPSLLLTCTLAVSAFAADLPAPVKGADHDWPQWRGPNRDGKSLDTNLLAEWPKDGPPLVFTITGMGKGRSTPAVAGDRLYITGKVNDKASAFAYKLSTQELLWTTEFSAKSSQEGENATPTIDGKRVYVMSSVSDLACLDADTGKIVWQKSLAREYGSTLQLGHYGYSEGPLVDGDNLIVTPGKQNCLIVALNKETGELKWKSEHGPFWEAERPGDKGFLGQGNDNAGYSSIVVSEACGIRQYVNLAGRGLVSVSAADGKFLWGYNRVAQGHTNIPTPIVKDDMVFVSNGYGGGTATVKLTKTDAGIKATPLFFTGDVQNHCGGYVLNDHYVYLGEGTYGSSPACIDMLTGKVQWKVKQPCAGVAVVIGYEDKAIFRYGAGNKSVILVEMTPKAYHEISSFTPASHKADGTSPPIIAQGLLFLRDSNSLDCYDVRKH